LGEIFDPFNGMQDIKRGIIRVLHNKSFIDDPTRIFRALRYKNRFGFRIDRKTLDLIKEAIAKNMVKRLTGERILNELRLIFAEETYYKTIQELSDFKIFKIKNSDLRVLPLIGPQKMHFYLSKLSTDKFPLSSADKKVISDFRKLGTTISKLKKSSQNSAICNILSPISFSVVNIIPVIQLELKQKIKIYQRLRKVKPFINGNDLKKLVFKPGVQFKGLLKKIFNLQLDKKIKSKNEAIKILKKLKYGK